MSRHRFIRNLNVDGKRCLQTTGNNLLTQLDYRDYDDEFSDDNDDEEQEESDASLSMMRQVLGDHAQAMTDEQLWAVLDQFEGNLDQAVDHILTMASRRTVFYRHRSLPLGIA